MNKLLFWIAAITMTMSLLASFLKIVVILGVVLLVLFLLSSDG